jgi:hypothetical protein
MNFLGFNKKLKPTSRRTRNRKQFEQFKDPELSALQNKW